MFGLVVVDVLPRARYPVRPKVAPSSPGFPIRERAFRDFGQVAARLCWYIVTLLSICAGARDMAVLKRPAISLMRAAGVGRIGSYTLSTRSSGS